MASGICSRHEAQRRLARSLADTHVSTKINAESDRLRAQRTAAIIATRQPVDISQVGHFEVAVDSVRPGSSSAAWFGGKLRI